MNREKKTAPTAIEKHAIAPVAALPAISSEGRHFQLHSGQFPSEGSLNEALRRTCVTVLSDEISSVSPKGRPLIGAGDKAALWPSKAGEQPRIPPLRAVIADRDAQRLLLPDQHEQPLAPRDPRVDQVALQQHVVLRGERDHHCRELRTLRLVDRDRVGQRNLVQFPEVVFDQPVVEAHRDLCSTGSIRSTIPMSPLNTSLS